jgi:hypothetical protein
MTRTGQLGFGAGVAFMMAALTGCAGSPPSSPLALEVVQSSACVDSIEDQPAFAQLRLKSPALGDMSSTHLGDTSKPTPEEQALARDYLAAVSACEPKTQSMVTRIRGFRAINGL